MQEEYTNVITLTDSDGSDVDFEVLDIVPYKEHEYVVMLPVDDESDSPEAVILELLEAEEDNEEDMLQGVDDEEILNAVFNLFMEKNADEFQFEQYRAYGFRKASWLIRSLMFNPGKRCWPRHRRKHRIKKTQKSGVQPLFRNT